MSNSIFLHIADDYYLKSDSNSFSICIDKGDTKFPGGLIAKYYKPITWYYSISDIKDRINKLNIKPIDDFSKYISEERQFFKILSENKCKFEGFVFQNYEFETSVDSASLKLNDKYIAHTYNVGNLFKSCYIHHLRHSNIDNYNDLFETLIVFKNGYENICSSNIIHEAIS